MLRAMEGRGWFVAVACLVLAGCRPAAQTPYRDFSEPVESRSTVGPNAFADYVEAATSAEAIGGQYRTRTNFTPGQKDRLIALLAKPLAKVDGAGGKPCRFEFQPTEPFAQKPYRAGWRLIGLALGWRIQNDVRDERMDDAIRHTMIAVRFGFDLVGGDCTDASLGFSIVDDARRALLEAAPKLTATQFAEIAQALQTALDRMPSLRVTIANEKLAMTSAIQSIQQAYREKDLSRFRLELRQEIQPAIKYLQGLSENDPKRAEFFDGLAKEAEVLCDEYDSQTMWNAAQRALRPEPKFVSSRPWRRWSKFFFQAPKGLFPIRDRTVAQTRLFALHAAIRSKTRSSGFPKSLAAYPKALRTDPYSGLDFVYSSAQTSYKLYSVGADFRDDGGETDEAFTTPDLSLETRAF